MNTRTVAAISTSTIIILFASNVLAADPSKYWDGGRIIYEGIVGAIVGYPVQKGMESLFEGDKEAKRDAEKAKRDALVDKLLEGAKRNRVESTPRRDSELAEDIFPRVESNPRRDSYIDGRRLPTAKFCSAEFGSCRVPVGVPIGLDCYCVDPYNGMRDYGITSLRR